MEVETANAAEPLTKTAEAALSAQTELEGSTSMIVEYQALVGLNQSFEMLEGLALVVGLEPN